MNLTKYALITAIFGIILIVFLSVSLESRYYNLSEINYRLIGQEVRVTGEIIKINSYPSSTGIMIADRNGSVYVFSRAKLNLSKGDWIEAKGKVSDYKGNIEIEADKLSLLFS